MLLGFFDEAMHEAEAGANGRVQRDEVEAPAVDGSEAVAVVDLGVRDGVETKVPAGEVDGATVDVYESDMAIGCEEGGDDADDAVATAEVEDAVGGFDVEVFDEKASAAVDALAGEDTGFRGELEGEAAEVGFDGVGAAAAGGGVFAEVVVGGHEERVRRRWVRLLSEGRGIRAAIGAACALDRRS